MKSWRVLRMSVLGETVTVSADHLFVLDSGALQFVRCVPAQKRTGDASNPVIDTTEDVLVAMFAPGSWQFVEENVD